MAYDCFCVNNDSILLRLTDGRNGDRRGGKGFPCLWQFFATFLLAKGGEKSEGVAGGNKSFLISNKSKGVNNARRLDLPALS